MSLAAPVSPTPTFFFFFLPFLLLALAALSRSTSASSGSLACRAASICFAAERRVAAAWWGARRRWLRRGALERNDANGYDIIDLPGGKRRLAETGPNALLRELATTDALLTRPADSARVAIISYRQESSSKNSSVAVTADAEPDLTLDGEALLSAIAAAKRGGALARRAGPRV